MNLSEAQNLLLVGDKFTTFELKAAFRKASFITHPDSGGSEEAFIELQEAYKQLQKLATMDKAMAEEKTVEGTPLSELGKGFPLTVSAKTCKMCDGRGWKSFSSGTREEECIECLGDGMFWVACKRCNGTGKYTHVETGKIVGECYGCGGTGRFYPKYKPHMRSKVTAFFGDWLKGLRAKYITLKNGERIRVNSCRRCGGTGRMGVPDDKYLTYMTCEKCHGVGEEEMWNPVLPKGLFEKA